VRSKSAPHLQVTWEVVISTMPGNRDWFRSVGLDHEALTVHRPDMLRGNNYHSIAER
jgi:hypothetical protein